VIPIARFNPGCRGSDHLYEFLPLALGGINDRRILGVADGLSAFSDAPKVFSKPIHLKREQIQ